MRNTKVGPWSWERRVPKYFRVFSARFFFFCFFSRPCHPFFHVYVNPGTQNVGMRGVTELNSKFRGRCIRIQRGAVHTFNGVILRKLKIRTHGTYYRNVQFTLSSVNIPQRTNFFTKISLIFAFILYFPVHLCVKKFARSLMVLWNFMEFCDSLMFARSQMVKKSVFFFSTFHTMKQITGKQKVLVFKNILLNHVCKLYKKQQPESFNVKNKTMQFLSVLQIVLLVRFVWRDHVHIVRI